MKIKTFLFESFEDTGSAGLGIKVVKLAFFAK